MTDQPTDSHTAPAARTLAGSLSSRRPNPSDANGGVVRHDGRGSADWRLSLIAAATPECRDGVVVRVGGKLYLLGGYRSRSPFETQQPKGTLFAPCQWLYELDPSEQHPAWRQLPRLTTCDRRHLPRPGMIACGVNGNIYTYGGYRHDGFTGDMHVISLSNGSCSQCNVSLRNSPLEDEYGTRLSGILWQGRWVVARRVAMPACLYFFDFWTEQWTCEEHRVEGREHGLMCIQELQVHEGHLYALNAESVNTLEHQEEGPGPCRLEVRRLEGTSWVRADSDSSPLWLQQVKVFETFFSGAVAGDWWVLWGSLSYQTSYPGDDFEILDPPELLNATSMATCVTSDWRNDYKAHPIAFNFTTMSWTRVGATADGGALAGPAPLARRLHCVAAVPGGNSLVVVGGEVLTVPGETEMPIACHVVERIDLPGQVSGQAGARLDEATALPSPSDLWEDMQSTAEEVLDDRLCDVQVFPRGSPGSIVRFSAALMCQRSEVFRRMLTSSMLEGTKRELEVPPVGVATVRAFRHLCHLELTALKASLADVTTLMELHSLCHTYLLQPLGVKLTRDILESWFAHPTRGMEHVANFWRAIHETALTEVYHQGIPELVAEFLLLDYPSRLRGLKNCPQFKALSGNVGSSLVEYVEQAALQAQVEAMGIAGSSSDSI